MAGWGGTGGGVAQVAELTELMLKSATRNAGMAVRLCHSPHSRDSARTVRPASVVRASTSIGLSLKRKLLTAPTTSPSSTR